MAVLSTAYPTLLDVARRIDPQGKIPAIIEVLNKYNEILDDMAWVEGNLPTGHQVTVRSGLPTATWRLANQGISPVKSETNKIVETCGELAAYSTIDRTIAELNGNTADFRASEDVAFLEGMNQQLATALIYGDTSVNPEQFVGLSPRYYSKTAATAPVTYTNVIDAGGDSTANLTSVWVVAWSDQTVHGIFPKGSKAGFQMQDLGEQTVYDSDGKPYQAYRTFFQWKCGISVKDWRFVVRIANINIDALETATDTSDTSCNLLKYINQALDKFPPIGSVRPVIYANQRVRAMLRAKLQAKSNAFITISELESPIYGFKRPTLQFMGVPVRRCDSILNTETIVS